ncbi:MAG: MoaD/ThiS family protein [Planctomycetaceae bacterium]|nr:MoaD/ThiS family protein [Planctomycetaceae bacterium]
MKITVLLFAAAAEVAGTRQVVLPFPESDLHRNPDDNSTFVTAAQLRSRLASAIPKLQPLSHSLLISVNNHYADNTTPITESDTIACFPPVSGG